MTHTHNIQKEFAQYESDMKAMKATVESMQSIYERGLEELSSTVVSHDALYSTFASKIRQATKATDIHRDAVKTFCDIAIY